MAEKIGNVEDGADNGPVEVVRDGTEGLELFDSEESEMDLKDKQPKITISPMNMGQIRAFMKEAATILPALQLMFADGVKKGAVDVPLKALTDLDGDSFYRCIAVAAGIDMKRLDGLMPDVFAQLTAKVLAVNLDFFAQRLPDVLAGAADTITGAWNRLKSVGSTASRS